jgi:hypothetical protein
MMPPSPEKRQLALRANVVLFTIVWLASSTAAVISGHMGADAAVFVYFFGGLALGLIARLLPGRAVWTVFSKSERALSITEESTWPVQGWGPLRRWWPIVAIVYALLEVSMPAKQRRRRHDQTSAALRREHSSERREERRIVGPSRHPADQR